MIPILDVGASRSYLFNHPWQVAAITLFLILQALLVWAIAKKYPHRRKALSYTCVILVLGAGIFNYWVYKAQEVSVGQKLHSIAEEATKKQTAQ